jgi:hypothetical protein
MLTEAEFDNIFTEGSKAHEMGKKLREIISDYFDDLEENAYGGAKVKLTLYSRGNLQNVLCGLQEGSEDSCMLYVHHVEEIDHERLKFSGKGKNAKRIKFHSPEEVIEEDIKWLLSLVDEAAD